MYVIEQALSSMIYLPSFMKTGKGIQAILRFDLSNLNGCNVGINDGRYLLSVPMRWAQVARYTYKVS
jgi:hypothetical protein